MTQPGPPANLTIAINPATVLPGQSATLTWSTLNATSCTASGAWTGSQSTSGSINVILQASKAQDYTLLCSGTGVSAQKTVTLTVPPNEAGCTTSQALAASRVRTPRAIAAARHAVATGTAGPRRSRAQ